MRRASLLVLFLTVFIDLIGFGMVIPFLSFYAREYGASGVMVGAVVGVYSIMQSFFAPVWGRLSDGGGGGSGWWWGGWLVFTRSCSSSARRCGGGFRIGWGGGPYC